MANEFETNPVQGESSGQSANNTESLLAEVTRLRQDLAKSRDLNRDAKPLVQLAQALYSAPGGREIIAKLERREPLTVAETATAAAAAKDSGQVPNYLTAEQAVGIFRQELQQFQQADYETRKAEREIANMDDRAKKELDGYANIQGTPQWNAGLNTILQMIDSKAIEVPSEESDPIWWAIKRNHEMLTGLKPGEVKETPAEMTEAERRAGIAGQAGSRGGAPQTDSDLDKNPDMAWARQRGKSTVGKSFSNN